MLKMVVRLVSMATLLLLVRGAIGQSQGEGQKANPKPGLFDKGSSGQKSETTKGAIDKGLSFLKGDAKGAKTGASSLGELLAQALENNPDIRVAEAKVRETEAELNRIRMQIAQRVITLSQSLEAQKERVKLALDLMTAQTTQYQTGRISINEFTQARASLDLEK